MITIDVEIGTVILTGKFKNKKTVVKTIGTDDHGMPTINGKRACTFRIAKEQPMENKIPKLKDIIKEDVSIDELTSNKKWRDGKDLLIKGFLELKKEHHLSDKNINTLIDLTVELIRRKV